MGIPQDPEEQKAYYENVQGKYTMSRMFEYVGLLAFLLVGLFTFKDLAMLIYEEMSHWRGMFNWVDLNKLVPMWPAFLVTGIIWYFFRTVREHYENILWEAGLID